jgi:uncharacterized repeat protein (TIGR03806 family)
MASRVAWKAYSVVAVVLSVAAGVYCFWPRHGLAARVANETVRLPLSAPGDAAWAVQNAFPHLKFVEPTCVVPARDGSRRLFVLERHGTIQMLRNEASTTTKRQVLDIFNQVMREPYEDDGALGLVLHPEFGRADSPHRGYFYVFYTARANGRRYDRLSRFTIPDGQVAADPASELILIDQLDEDIWHNGGALAFGPDGFLYVGLGDEGGNEPDQFANGQRIDKDLFSGILRIDVDCRGGEVSHSIRRQPQTGRTNQYFIPSDNPFVGVPGALEEFWSIGFRSPHRIAFDESGRLWVGDVGQQHREEINLAARGTNHQWSYAEGRLPLVQTYLHGQKPAPFLGIETPPIHDYPHHNGDNCVIGGFVYRGKKLPELHGKYLYGDNGSGRIWAMSHDGQRVASNTELLSLPYVSKTGLASFAEDTDGEPLLVVLGEPGQEDGSLYRLAKAPPGSSPLPRRLSETGLFADVIKLTPAPGVIPYDINSPLWSDGAHKRRWLLLPGDGADPDPAADRIEYMPQGNWSFPAGTVFVKHFELPIDETDSSRTKRLETRFLVRQTDGGAYGVTYKWNDEGTDAELLAAGLREDITVRTADGGSRVQTWQYPSRETCLVCHTRQANHVLGVNARQLNRDYAYPGTSVVRNQLREWSRAGLFTRTLSDREIDEAPRLAAIDNRRASLEHRVRSYLDANCSHCHRPGGVRANFDARFETPLAEQGLLNGPLATQTGLPGTSVVRPGDPSRSMLLQRLLDREKPMPTVGVLRRDTAALGLLCEWIESLAPAPTFSEPAREGESRVPGAESRGTSDDAPEEAGAPLRSAPATRREGEAPAEPPKGTGL